MVEFDLPFCVYLPDGAYPVSTDGVRAAVGLERRRRKHIDERLPIDEGDFELVRDRYGLVRYTQVRVELGGPAVMAVETRRAAEAGEVEAAGSPVRVQVTADDIDERFGEPAVRMAVDAVNHLLSTYRVNTEEVHVRPVPLDDLFCVDVEWLHGERSLGGHRRMNFGRGATLPVEALSSDVVAEIRRQRAAGRRPYTALELFADARDHLDRGEHRTAVIDARTAVEILVDDVLSAYFHSGGRSVADAIRVLNPRLGAQRREKATVDEALHNSAVNRRLSSGLKAALALDLESQPTGFWDRWLRAKELRESGAHRGQAMGKDEAVKAVNAMGVVMEQIITALRTVDWLNSAPS